MRLQLNHLLLIISIDQKSPNVEDCQHRSSRHPKCEYLHVSSSLGIGYSFEKSSKSNVSDVLRQFMIVGEVKSDRDISSMHLS